MVGYIADTLGIRPWMRRVFCSLVVVSDLAGYFFSGDTLYCEIYNNPCRRAFDEAWTDRIYTLCERQERSWIPSVIAMHGNNMHAEQMNIQYYSSDFFLNVLYGPTYLDLCRVHIVHAILLQYCRTRNNGKMRRLVSGGVTYRAYWWGVTYDGSQWRHMLIVFYIIIYCQR